MTEQRFLCGYWWAGPGATVSLAAFWLPELEEVDLLQGRVVVQIATTADGKVSWFTPPPLSQTRREHVEREIAKFHAALERVREPN